MCCVCGEERIISNLLGQLLHAVKSAASLEPSNLQVVERMVKLNLFDFVTVLDLAIDGLAGRQAVKIKQRNLARRLNLNNTKEIRNAFNSNVQHVDVYLVVISGIGEGQWQQTLFLQVCLVDASERFNNDGASAKVTWFQSGMLAGRALAVVLITDSNPLDVVGLVVTSNLGHTTPAVGALVLNFVHLVVLVVGGTNEHVIRNVVQMTTVFQPGAGGRDVIGGALSLDLDQNGQILQILTVPFVEGLQQLQTLRFGIDNNLDIITALKRI